MTEADIARARKWLPIIRAQLAASAPNPHQITPLPRQTPPPIPGRAA